MYTHRKKLLRTKLKIFELSTLKPNFIYNFFMVKDIWYAHSEYYEKYHATVEFFLSSHRYIFLNNITDDLN